MLDKLLWGLVVTYPTLAMILGDFSQVTLRTVNFIQCQRWLLDQFMHDINLSAVLGLCVSKFNTNVSLPLHFIHIPRCLCPSFWSLIFFSSLGSYNILGALLIATLATQQDLVWSL